MDLLFAPSRAEVETASAYLLENFGGEAAREADRLALVYQRLGARRTARIYKTIGHRLAAAAPAPAAGGGKG
ncbi:MAG TPA: hypothetical protein PKA55_10950 [Rhodoblastus sp.]|nr:hypothetical protein [Rhodoblastus sp.]